MSSQAQSYEPMAALNITPLIRVWLVLIVTFILCLPVASHELPIDLPGQPGPASEAPVRRLAIGAGETVSWDGAAVDAAALDGRLRGAVNEGAQLTFAPDARTRFDVDDRTLVIVKRAGVARLGIEGHERCRAAF